jgi:hypothetical protein
MTVLEYKIGLCLMAKGFADAYSKCKVWEVSKKEKCLDGLMYAYKAIKEEK